MNSVLSSSSSPRYLMAALFGALVVAASAGCHVGQDELGANESEAVTLRDCDIQKITCEITPPRCEDGQTPSVKDDCYGPCVAIDKCRPGTFECDQGPAFCEIVPPRCPAGQTLTTRDECFGPCVPSSVCKPPSAPSKGSADCDISKVECEIVTPRCPDGQTPTVSADGFCYGDCAPIEECKPHSFQCNQGGPALCEIVPPRCAPGERLTTIDDCFGPCVPEEVCK